MVKKKGEGERRADMCGYTTCTFKGRVVDPSTATSVSTKGTSTSLPNIDLKNRIQSKKYQTFNMSAAVAENPRGIPKADFVEDIPGLMEKTSLTAAELIEQADTQYNKVRSAPFNESRRNILVRAAVPLHLCVCLVGTTRPSRLTLFWRLPLLERRTWAPGPLQHTGIHCFCLFAIFIKLVVTLGSWCLLLRVACTPCAANVHRHRPAGCRRGHIHT